MVSVAHPTSSVPAFLDRLPERLRAGFVAEVRETLAMSSPVPHHLFMPEDGIVDEAATAVALVENVWCNYAWVGGWAAASGDADHEADAELVRDTLDRFEGEARAYMLGLLWEVR